MRSAYRFFLCAALGTALCLGCFGPVFYPAMAVCLLPLGYRIGVKTGRTRLCALALLLALFLLRCFALSEQSAQLIEHNGKSAKITLVITDAHDTLHPDGGYRSAILEKSDVPYLKAGQRLALYTDTLYREGTRLSMRCTLYADLTPRASTSWHASGYVSAVSPLGTPKVLKSDPLWKAIGRLRLYLNDNLYAKSRHGPLLAAILYGNRADVSDAVTNAFRCSGISHLLVVSGFHFTLLLFGLLFVLRAIGLPRWCRGIAAALWTVGLCLLCGMTPSVLRAAVFYLYFDLYRLVGRLGQSLYCLTGALCALLFYNPYLLFSVSLQLSFAATYGLLIARPFLVSVLRVRCAFFARHRTILETICLPLSAWLFTLPVTWWHFGHFAVLAVPINLLLTPFMSCLLPLIAAALIVTRVMPAVGSFLLTLCDGLCDLPVKTAAWVASLPFSYPALHAQKCAAVLLVALYVLIYERITGRGRYRLRCLIQRKRKDEKS